jgi:hypothetical protein
MGNGLQPTAKTNPISVDNLFLSAVKPTFMGTATVNQAFRSSILSQKAIVERVAISLRAKKIFF